MISATRYHKSVTLTSDQISSTHDVCPLCGSSSFVPVVSLQKNSSVSLMRCSCCHAVFADKVPSDTFLSAYYSFYYADNPSGCTCTSSDRFAKHIYREMKIGESRSYRILDFGGGNGALSLSLATRIVNGNGCSVKIVVVDYYPDTVQSHDSGITIEHCNTLDGVTGYFDVVIASSVLDHLSQPKPVMERLCSMLASGGFFYVRTSYVMPLMKAFSYFGVKIDFTYPGHLYDFSQAFWESAPEKVFASDSMTLVVSRPSPVETSFRMFPVRTVAAWVLKSLWFLTCGRWKIVGGWEAGFVKR